MSAEAVVTLVGDGVQVGLPDHVRWDAADAQRLTDRLRTSLLGAGLALTTAADLYAEAWTRRADMALGYKSWDAYLEAELGSLAHLSIPVEVRVAMVRVMDSVGMPARKIGRALGVSDYTARQSILAAQQPALAAAPEPAAPAEAKPTKTSQALAALARAGADGLTIPELQRRRHWTYSQTSPTLSRLEQQHAVVRLAQARGGYAVHVLPEHAAGREVMARRARRPRTASA